MLFNSGFGGALGTISGLLRKTDVAVMDNRSHLSLRDGAVLARSRLERFEHNDPASLGCGSIAPERETAASHRGRHLFDGRRFRVASVSCSNRGIASTRSVFIDEAHSMLACGQTGRGAAEHFGVAERIPLIYGTFSKAFGALGGFVAGLRRRCDYLRFYAHSYVYSCALPAAVIAAILKALEIGASQPQLRTALWANAEYFRTQLNQTGDQYRRVDHLHHAAGIGDRKRMYRLGHELRRRGLFVAPVDYPAVPEEGICFRACVTANHTRADHRMRR